MGWGWWSKIFGGDVVKTAGQVFDDLNYSNQEQAQDDLTETNSARQFAAPGESHNGIFNDLVDAYNRLIRPAITTWLIGGFSGWWKLPSPSFIDPFWLQVFLIVVTFWFGGRVLLKDLPAVFQALMKFRAFKKRL